ncbi:MAG: hypothetical protein ABEJ70_04780 [Halobacteriaceae archaeon]
MPEITVSEELYRQLTAEAEADDAALDRTLWRMVGSYRRSNRPESDTA